MPEIPLSGPFPTLKGPPSGGRTLPGMKKQGEGRAFPLLPAPENAFRTLGVRLVGAHSFLLSEEAGMRTVCVLEKYRDTPAAYPRGRGKERSKPL